MIRVEREELIIAGYVNSNIQTHTHTGPYVVGGHSIKQQNSSMVNINRIAPHFLCIRLVDEGAKSRRRGHTLFWVSVCMIRMKEN